METKSLSSHYLPWLLILSLFVIISIVALSAYSLIKPVSHNTIAPAAAQPQLKQPAKLSPTPTASPSAQTDEDILGEIDSLEFGEFQIKEIEQ